MAFYERAGGGNWGFYLVPSLQLPLSSPVPSPGYCMRLTLPLFRQKTATARCPFICCVICLHLPPFYPCPSRPLTRRFTGRSCPSYQISGHPERFLHIKPQLLHELLRREPSFSLDHSPLYSHLRSLVVPTKATVGGVPPFSLVCLSHSRE